MAHASTRGFGSRDNDVCAPRSLVLVLVVASALAGSGCRRDEKPGTAQTTGAEVTVPAAPPPFPTPPVTPGTPDVPTLVATVKLGVVNITTTQEIARRPGGFDPFEFFFGRRQSMRGGDEVLQRRALGTGFLVDAAGHVATNAHVVAGASSVRVTLSDGREHSRKRR